MSLPKHILFLVPGFPSDVNDFNCIPPLQEFLLKFKSAYPSAKISVIAIQYPYRNKHYLWNSINIFPMAGKNKVYMKPLVWLRAIRIAKNLNKDNRIDVIHSLWFGECAMLGNILSNKFNCEHICTLMGQDASTSNLYQRFPDYQKIKFVAVSKRQSYIFSNRTNRKVEKVIHWGIADRYLSNLDRDIDLLAAGSLIPLKNYSLLINVLEEIKALKPDIKCVLAGSGQEEAKLKSLVNKKGLEENIKFAGLLSREEILKLMQRSKILIHPSSYEGFGFVFAEALVSGMNIVSFDVGAALKNSKWFIAKDEIDFISIVNKLISDKLDFNPVNIFTIKDTIEQYASIYGLE